MPESPAKEPAVAVLPDMTELRQLRDRVYGAPITDDEWASCGLNWSRPDSVAWLREKVKLAIAV